MLWENPICKTYLCVFFLSNLMKTNQNEMLQCWICILVLAFFFWLRSHCACAVRVTVFPALSRHMTTLRSGSGCPETPLTYSMAVLLSS